MVVWGIRTRGCAWPRCCCSPHPAGAPSASCRSSPSSPPCSRRPPVPCRVGRRRGADVLILDARTELVAARSCASSAGPSDAAGAPRRDGGRVAGGGRGVGGRGRRRRLGGAGRGGRPHPDGTGAGPGLHAREPERVEAGELVIDPSGYTARLRGRALDLTYKDSSCCDTSRPTPAGSSPGRSCSRRCGGTTTSRHPHRGRARPAAARQARGRVRQLIARSATSATASTSPGSPRGHPGGIDSTLAPDR